MYTILGQSWLGMKLSNLQYISVIQYKYHFNLWIQLFTNIFNSFDVFLCTLCNWFMSSTMCAVKSFSFKIKISMSSVLVLHFFLHDYYDDRICTSSFKIILSSTYECYFLFKTSLKVQPYAKRGASLQQLSFWSIVVRGLFLLFEILSLVALKYYEQMIIDFH